MWREYLVVFLLVIVLRFVLRDGDAVNPLDPSRTRVSGNHNPEGISVVGAKWFTIHLMQQVRVRPSTTGDENLPRKPG